MQWLQVHDTFLSLADSLVELVAGVEDFSVPALGTWNADRLTGHLLRAVVTPVHYLAEPEPDGGPLPAAADYFARYLDRRDEDPEAMAAGIAARAGVELDGIDPSAYPRMFREAAAAARAALQVISGDRKVPTPMGPMRIQDYLRTRILEATVHGVDLARATDSRWEPPDTAVADSLVLLTEISRHRGLGVDLLLALTGRTSCDDRALPVLS